MKLTMPLKIALLLLILFGSVVTATAQSKAKAKSLTNDDFDTAAQSATSQARSNAEKIIIASLRSEDVALSFDEIEQLATRVKSSPGDAGLRTKLIKALNATGVQAFNDGKNREAVSLLTRAYKLDNNNDVVLINLAFAELKERLYSEALAHAQQAVSISPKDQNAQISLGYAFYLSNDLVNAKTAFSRALELGEDFRLRMMLAGIENESKFLDRSSSGNNQLFNIVREHGTINSTLETELFIKMERIFEQLRQRFDYIPKERITVIFYSIKSFQDMKHQQGWVGGLNDGKIHIPIIFGNQTTYDERLTPTIAHEMAHSFIFYKTHGHCPVWLNEGLAMLSENRYKIDSRTMLALNKSSDLLPNLANLDNSFLSLSTADAAIAYSCSLIAVDILNKQAPNAIKKILDELAQGIDIKDAIAHNTRFKSVESFESEFHKKWDEMIYNAHHQNP